MRIRALILLAVGGMVVGGCGSDDEGNSPTVERQEETLDKLPDLPRGYEQFLNRDGGIVFGRPPGWTAKTRGATSTLTAPDGLVSATITIDRTDDALRGAPEDFAVQTAELLPGYEEPLDAGEPEEFEHPYEAAIVEAEGIARTTGVRERVSVIVLEREGAAVVTAVIADNAEEDTGAEVKQALEAISTLRTRPPL